MNKFKLFLENHGTKFILVLLVLTYFKSCSIDSELNKVRKRMDVMNIKITEQDSVISKLPNKTDLRIEGLRSEKRMIQSTDRRIYDVNRQNAIEKLIRDLQEKQ